MPAALALAALLGATPPSAAVEPRRFDIDCKVAEGDRTPGGLPIRHDRLSIDLLAGTWRRAGDARPPQAIHRTVGDLIILHDDGARVLRNFLAFDRAKMTLLRVGGGGRFRDTLACTVEAWTEPPRAE